MSQNSLNNSHSEQRHLSLRELSERIKECLKAGFPSDQWVIAEISEFRVHRSGHAYLDLVEKDEDSDRLVARLRATIWSFTYRILRPYFEGTTGYRLSSGIKILARVSVDYHSQYGLSLNIKDIDPNYTLGDLARRKAEIIEKLKENGVYNMNRELNMPPVPQRIAIISSESAAGYGDFINSLEKNPRNYHFNLNLFPALMQGEKAAESMIAALEKIYSIENEFDLVIIIRGGGASIELDCFNHFELASHIAQFPLPVLTGIGHERDETVADLVAWRSLKTPTAVAEYLIDIYMAFEEKLDVMETGILTLVNNILSNKKEKLASISKNLFLLTSQELKSNENRIREMAYQLRSNALKLILSNRSDLKEKEIILTGVSKNIIENHALSLIQHQKDLRQGSLRIIRESGQILEKLAKMIRLLNPDQILKRGYSITRKHGKPLKDAEGLKDGDTLETTLYKGQVKSNVSK